MPALLIRHKVADYPTWKRVFDEQGPIRWSNGCQGGEVFRNSDEPDEILILLIWDDPRRARLYLQSDELLESLRRDEPDMWILEFSDDVASGGLPLRPMSTTWSRTATRWSKTWTWASGRGKPRAPRCPSHHRWLRRGHAFRGSRTLVEHATEIVALLDGDGAIRCISKAVERVVDNDQMDDPGVAGLVVSTRDMTWGRQRERELHTLAASQEDFVDGYRHRHRGGDVSGAPPQGRGGRLGSRPPCDRVGGACATPGR